MTLILHILVGILLCWLFHKWVTHHDDFAYLNMHHSQDMFDLKKKHEEELEKAEKYINKQNEEINKLYRENEQLKILFHESISLNTGEIPEFGEKFYDPYYYLKKEKYGYYYPK